MCVCVCGCKYGCVCVCDSGVWLNKSHAITKFIQICSFTSVSSVFCDSLLAATSQLSLFPAFYFFYDAWRRLNELLFIVGSYVLELVCVCEGERVINLHFYRYAIVYFIG